MDYIVVGGGIAGVSCAEELSRVSPNSTIHLISGSPLIKAITNFTKLSRALEQFEVQEKPLSYITQLCPNVKVHPAKLVSIDSSYKMATLSNGSIMHYNKLCLCTGATPTLLVDKHPLVLGVRDVESVRHLQEKLVGARRVMVVGNGGIATEIVYEVSGCEIVWAIKDRSISHTFFDEGAAVFFLPHLVSGGANEEVEGGGVHKEVEGGGMLQVSPLKRTKYVDSRREEDQEWAETMGGALGPDWHSDLKMAGNAFDERSCRHVHVEYECEVKELLTHADIEARNITPTPFPGNTQWKANIETPRTDQETTNIETPRTNQETTNIETPRTDQGTENIETLRTKQGAEWPLYVVLTNGTIYGCDLVVSATGVTPNMSEIEILNGGTFAAGSDGGVKVDREMRTALADIYAAGDVCSVDWGDHSRVWFQMRLWTQARQMGAFAARCMEAHTNGDSLSLDFCFELFSHVTSFFGYKVVLLGLHNAQTLQQNYEVILRCTKGVEYVKVILSGGVMMGAVLVGETDLEETFENLILNQMDLSQLKDMLLDPDIDIEDYFD